MHRACAYVKQRAPTVAPLLIVLAVYLLVRSFFWSCQPVWDGARYYVSYLFANEAPFDFLNYSTDDHICQGFFLLMSLPYRLIKTDYYLFNVWLSIFSSLGLVAFYGLVRHLTFGRIQQWEAALVTCLFAFHPSVLSSMTHFNVDIGVLVFFLWYWLMLLTEHRIAAAFFGILLVLTKENMVLLLPLVLLFCWLKQPVAGRLMWLRRCFFAAGAPYYAFALVVFYKTVIRHQSPFWAEYRDSNPLATVLHALKPDVMLANYAGMIFILNFNWLIMLLWAVLFILLVRQSRSGGFLPQLKPAVMLALLFVCATGVFLLVRPYSNVRYVMVLFPIAMIALSELLTVLVQRQAVRAAVLSVLLGLFAAANVRTLDPASKVFFGTFPFGKHQVLHMTSRTGEHIGFGRDQLVYNLEYLRLGQLITRAMQDIRPGSNTFVLCAPWANFNMLPYLDKDTCRPTFEPANYVLPRYSDTRPVESEARDANPEHFSVSGQAYTVGELPNDVYYMVFPNFDNQWPLKLLNGSFPQKQEKVYDIDGYQLSVIHFAR